MTAQDANRLPDDIRRAAKDLVLLYFWLVDQGRAGETAVMFAPDSSLTFGPGAPNPGTISGDAIALAMAARGKQTHVTTRHILSNFIYNGQADGSVRVDYLLTLYRSDDENRDTYPASVADMVDILVPDDTQWLIKARTVSPVFNRAAS